MDIGSLEKENIPQEVIDEVSKTFNIDWSLFGKDAKTIIDDGLYGEMKSIKTTIPTGRKGQHQYTDAKTGEKVSVEFPLLYQIGVRGIFNEDTVKILQVMNVGEIIDTTSLKEK
jgi:hypothetical protein